MKKLLTIHEMSEQLQVSTSTIYKWVEKRRIPFIKMPNRAIRFDEAKIEQWLKERQIKANISGRLI